MSRAKVPVALARARKALAALPHTDGRISPHIQPLRDALTALMDAVTELAADVPRRKDQ